jgi:hypothetical protein
MQTGVHEAEIVDNGLKVSFIVPFGVDPSEIFEEAKQKYMVAVEGLKRKLEG